MAMRIETWVQDATTQAEAEPLNVYLMASTRENFDSLLGRERARKRTRRPDGSIVDTVPYRTMHGISVWQRFVWIEE